MVLSPVRPSVKVLIKEDNYGKFEVQPLERGYGATLGNALRRMLLSSIPGAAITGVRIEGVLHEFAPIPGMKEDVVQFLLNLKNVYLRVDYNELSPPDAPLTLRLDVKGTGSVTAADIQCPADVEIANPELYLATLSEPNASLRAEIFVEMGRGYMPASKMNRFKGMIGVIHVNALFSPVQKVTWTVEATLVAERTDFDRLILEVWTNGTIQPGEAISKAASLLRQQAGLFMDSEQFEREVAEGISPVLPTSIGGVHVPDMRVEELNFSSRTQNSLRRENIGTLRQLAQYSKEQLMAIKNFGKVSLDEVEKKLKEFGIHMAGSGPVEEDGDEN